MIENTFFFLFLFRPSVLGAGHGQNYKASNMKRNHYCVWKLYSIMLKRKSTWNVTFLKFLVPSTYIFTELFLLMKLFLSKCFIFILQILLHATLISWQTFSHFHINNCKKFSNNSRQAWVIWKLSGTYTLEDTYLVLMPKGRPYALSM